MTDDRDGLLRLAETTKKIAYATILLGTVCMTSAVLVIPLVFMQIQELELTIQADRKMCEMQSTVLLKEIADIEVELEDLIAQDHVRPRTTPFVSEGNPTVAVVNAPTGLLAHAGHPENPVNQVMTVRKARTASQDHRRSNRHRHSSTGASTVHKRRPDRQDSLDRRATVETTGRMANTVVQETRDLMANKESQDRQVPPGSKDLVARLVHPDRWSKSTDHQDLKAHQDQQEPP
ncbi:hypothetical protein AAVH_17738 [Aphelenchoides avenae]|nr:hypothetical protein AAVH_17738 [Aphelenchus avenae]